MSRSPGGVLGWNRVAYAILFVSVVLAAHASDVQLGALLDSGGSRDAWSIFAAFAHPDLSGDFVARILALALDSILIGLLGTGLAMVIGLTLAMAAIKVPRLPEGCGRAPVQQAFGDGIRFILRGVLSILRSIPDIVWAYLFVRTLGLGPGPAVLAIAVSSGGIMGKLFAELAEAVDPQPIHALRRSGARRFGILIYGVLPQVWRQWVAYSFFRLECAVRSASILGIVGAGGLGSEIALSLRYFEYNKLATALLAVLVFVIAIEFLSAFLRRRSFRWTLWLAIVGFGMALYRLDIPWSEFTLANIIPDWLLRGQISEPAQLAARALGEAVETVAMAWCATWGAAIVALLLSALAASKLMVAGHGRYAVRGGLDPHKGLRWLSVALARLVLQVTRAMPELTLALVFVVWVGPGPFAGVMAIGIHTIGVLGRLYTDVYDEIDVTPVTALEHSGASRLGVWLYGVLPQAGPGLLAFTLYRFEVNVRATAMVGFVGAGGIGDSIHTAISLFHGPDLLLLLLVLIALVMVLDNVGDYIRHRLLLRRFRSPASGDWTAPRGATKALPKPPQRRAVRQARVLAAQYRPRGTHAFQRCTILNISKVGMFIETDELHPVGTVLELALPSETWGRRVQATCLTRVVNSKAGEPTGMGLEILDALPREFRLAQRSFTVPPADDETSKKGEP